jgi:hypothetical protein
VAGRDRVAHAVADRGDAERFNLTIELIFCRDHRSRRQSPAANRLDLFMR